DGILDGKEKARRFGCGTEIDLIILDESPTNNRIEIMTEVNNLHLRRDQGSPLVAYHRLHGPLIGAKHGEICDIDRDVRLLTGHRFYSDRVSSPVLREGDRGVTVAEFGWTAAQSECGQTTARCSRHNNMPRGFCLIWAHHNRCWIGHNPDLQ